MRIPLYQVDAFADRMFTGNPAAVCLLTEWLPDPLLQAIAAENNLSETAFVVPREDLWELRWFTPTIEVALCGHATLASGHVLMNVTDRRDSVDFETRSGRLSVGRQEDRLTMDFPAIPPGDKIDDAAVSAALVTHPAELYSVRAVHGSRYLMAVYASADEVAALEPDIRALRCENANVIATAPGDDVDFVSRFFAPASGVDEDPVTGSAHCTLAPYWSDRLGRGALEARQISKRGGSLSCRLRGHDRVELAGRCVLYLRGEIDVET